MISLFFFLQLIKYNFIFIFLNHLGILIGYSSASFLKSGGPLFAGSSIDCLSLYISTFTQFSQLICLKFHHSSYGNNFQPDTTRPNLQYLIPIKPKNLLLTHDFFLFYFPNYPNETSKTKAN